MNPNHTFTEKYFFDEVLRFRKAMGDKDWWNHSEDQRQHFVDGLAFVYLNIINDDGTLPEQNKINDWATLFNATMMEYNRRAIILGKLT